MSRLLIYLIAVFALWMYFSISETKTQAQSKNNTVESYDKAQSGNGGTMVSNSGNTSTRIDWVKDVGTNETAILEQLNKLRTRSNA